MRIDIDLSIKIDGVEPIINNSRVGFNIQNASPIYAIKKLMETLNHIAYRELMIELRNQPEPDYGEEVPD